jgi:DNA-binding Lrp family transcriptional regulator
MSEFWNDLDDDVLRCLATRSRMSPAEIGRRLGLSEDAVVSLVAMLAHEGKVRIGLVESSGRHAVAA